MASHTLTHTVVISVPSAFWLSPAALHVVSGFSISDSVIEVLVTT